MSQVWHIWRRLRDSEADWQQVLGLKGGKLDAHRAMEMLDGQASFVEYEYHACQGDARPTEGMKLGAWGRQ